MRKNSILILVVLTTSLFCNLWVVCAADNPLEFNIPLPAGSKLLDSKQVRMSNLQVETFLYASDQDINTISNYYRGVFQEEGFTKIYDQLDTKSNRQLLRFQKDNLVVSFAVFLNKQNQANIIIAKYLQEKGELSIEEAKPSVNDTLFAFPTEDVPGVDYLPRPPQSVRIASSSQGQMISLIYSTVLDVDAAISFYRKQMLNDDWDFESQTSAAEAAQEYMKINGKKELGLELPFSDNENIDQVVNDSYVLNFSSGADKAEITIFPNFASRRLGSIVQISYYKSE